MNKSNVPFIRFGIIHMIVLCLAIVFDQITKVYARTLKGKPAIVLIEDVLELRYLENRGAAFGILQGQSILFLFIAVLVLAFMVIFFLRVPKTARFYPLSITFTFMTAGAIGNTIDRLYYGFVTDFIYFKLIDFPTFNVADIWITCSTFFLLYLIFFKYKDSDFDFLQSKTEKNKK